jgi:hypothetical protein
LQLLRCLQLALGIFRLAHIAIRLAEQNAELLESMLCTCRKTLTSHNSECRTPKVTFLGSSLSITAENTGLVGFVSQKSTLFTYLYSSSSLEEQILRYGNTIERELNRTYERLERLQRRRQGEKYFCSSQTSRRNGFSRSHVLKQLPQLGRLAIKQAYRQQNFDARTAFPRFDP